MRAQKLHHLGGAFCFFTAVSCHHSTNPLLRQVKNTNTIYTVCNQILDNKLGRRNLCPANHRQKVNQQVHSTRGAWITYIIILLFAALVVLFFGFLAVMIVPAPNANSAFEVTGQLASISQPVAEGDDLQITLRDGRNFYVNRANEISHFDWQQMQKDVQVGDTIHLTVVKPLAWQLTTGTAAPQRGPVAGITTDDTVYLDATIAAQTWTAQMGAVQNTLISFAVFMILLLGAMFFKEYGRLQLRGV